MRTTFFFSAFLVCAVAACGSVSKEQPDAAVDSAIAAGDFALAVDTTTLSSAITGTSMVTLTVTRDAALTDAIALTATGLPAGVTATFGAASLPAGTDTTTVTLAIDYAASAGTTDVTITGTAGALTHSQTVSLELHTQTVAGKVRGDVMGATVRIVGKTATTSDATGNFTFTDVKVPYDLYVLGQGGPDNAPIPAVTYYKGLSRLDPVVTKQYAYCSASTCFTLFNTKSATVQGGFVGGGSTAGPTYWKFTTAGDGQINTTGTWSYTLGWFAAFANNTRIGRLQGMQATRGTANAPTGWLYYQSSADITLTNQQTTTNVDLNLATLGTTANLVGTITPPTGFGTPTVTLTQTMAGWAFEVWTAATTNAASTIPVLAGQVASFHAKSSGSTGTTEGVVPGISAATDVSMSLPLPASITGPVSGATNVTATTPFTFMTPANQVYEVTMSSGAAIYVIYTTSGSQTIPDLEEMPLPSATSFSWGIVGYGPVTTGIEAAADTVALYPVSKFESTGVMHTTTTSPTRTFTTQ
jgi:hypothetical protein